MRNETHESLSQLTVRAFEVSTWQGLSHLVSGLLVIVLVMSLTPLILVYVERKIAAHFQCRLGPMRVGWHGTLQTLADALKLLLKEDIVPTAADRFLHGLAPLLCVLGALLSLIALPAGPATKVADMDIGVLYLAAITGFGVLGVLLGGWG
ncbi:MAG: complex I subunit 1 family protein, partial [Bdellovibrionota bacterium]